jgi:hypothetical protein
MMTKKTMWQMKQAPHARTGRRSAEFVCARPPSKARGRSRASGAEARPLPGHRSRHTVACELGAAQGTHA